MGASKEMTSVEVLEPWIEETRQRVASFTKADPSWLQSLRNSAIDEFVNLGFPTRRDEEWRYSRISPLAQGPFWNTVSESTAEIDLQKYSSPAFNGPRIVFVDGVWREDLTSYGELPEGLTIEPISKALARKAPGLEPTISRVPSGKHPFHHLNTASFADGVYLSASKDCTFEPLIHVLCIGGLEGGGASHLRHCYDVAGGASVSVVEEYRDFGSTFTNVVADVRVGTEGRLERVKIAAESDQSNHISYLTVQQEEESTFRDLFFATGGGVTRNEIEATLDGEEVECTLNGLYHLDGKRELDNHTLLRHTKPNCRSWEMYRGVLEGKSRGIFTGKIHVFQDAQKTDAKQNSNTILLSKDAEAASRPRLEIHADDVRCTHGATVGELDESALFYLASRGIAPSAARDMLVLAFAGEVLETLGNEAMRAELTQRLGDSLAKNRD